MMYFKSALNHSRAIARFSPESLAASVELGAASHITKTEHSEPEQAIQTTEFSNVPSAIESAGMSHAKPALY